MGSLAEDAAAILIRYNPVSPGIGAVLQVYDFINGAIKECKRLEKANELLTTHCGEGSEAEAFFLTLSLAWSDATGPTQIYQAFSRRDTNRIFFYNDYSQTKDWGVIGGRFGLGMAQLAGTVGGYNWLREMTGRKPIANLAGEWNPGEPTTGVAQNCKALLDPNWISGHGKRLADVKAGGPLVISDGAYLPFKTGSVEVFMRSAPVGYKKNIYGYHLSPLEIYRISRSLWGPMYSCPCPDDGGITKKPIRLIRGAR